MSYTGDVATMRRPSTPNPTEPMSKQDILAIASSLTIVDDGQCRVPVETAELNEWVAANGDISTDYCGFCAAVEYLGANLADPGTAAMNDLCDELIAAGADSI
jgi:hypothetical protein